MNSEHNKPTMTTPTRPLYMRALNLPAYELRVRDEGGRASIFDALRGKWVALTPEEWVRQNFVGYLTRCKGYPAGLIANEAELRTGDKRVRCDSVVYDNRQRPRMIIEYKAPEVALTRRVFDQAVAYNTVLHADWLVVSNGLRHVCCRINYADGSWAFVDYIPDYTEIKNHNQSI